MEVSVIPLASRVITTLFMFLEFCFILNILINREAGETNIYKFKKGDYRTYKSSALDV